MKNGRLNKREIETLERSAEILNRFCDWQEDHDRYDSEEFSLAAQGAGAISNLLPCLYDNR